MALDNTNYPFYTPDQTPPFEAKVNGGIYHIGKMRCLILDDGQVGSLLLVPIITEARVSDHVLTSGIIHSLADSLLRSVAQSITDGWYAALGVKR